MNRQPHTPDLSREVGPDRWETEAAESAGVRAPRQAPGPPWLQPADLAMLARRFPPLGAAQVRQLALTFHQGSTPIEILILRLTGAGLAPMAARQLLAELRDLRDRPGRETTPSE